MGGGTKIDFSIPNDRVGKPGRPNTDSAGLQQNPEISGNGRKRMRNWMLNAFLCIGSSFLILILLEGGTRVYDGEYSTKNFLAEERTLFTAGFPCHHDEYLGWVPQKGYSGKKNYWGTEVTIKEYGIRSNGKEEMPVSSSTPPILTVGDSFTFGDYVSNHESWPAILERLLGQKVINAGVFGYGIDQSYLRAEQLIEVFEPKMVIFGFHPNDIDRCELSERTAVEKPFFDIVNDRLVLRNIPVPRPSQKKVIGPVRHLLGYSYFVHRMMMSRFRGYWLEGKNWLSNNKVHSDGEKVACLLFQKLEEVARAHSIKEIYVLVQYTADPTPEEFRRVDNVLSGIGSLSLQVIDLRYELSKIRMADEAKYAGLFAGHMTGEGNYFVARELEKAIKGSALQ